jgi:protein tyrosine/serine phosphatase
MYKIFVTTCQHEIKKAVMPLVDPNAFPVVIHCTHGKDRTGVTIGILLALMGVPLDDILADYGRSAPEIRAAMARGDVSDEHPALQMKDE